MPCSSRICFLVFLATLLVATETKTISVSNNNNNNNNLSTDKASLVAFKSYVTSDPKNILKNGWSDSAYVCNWTGVTCGTYPRRVVGLNLSYASLVGTVPPHLGNLTYLAALLLTNNSFQGLLPRELSRLSQLKTLNFGFNNLTGEIPSWIGSLSKLQGLWLNDNQFSGSIPPAVSNLTSLKEFVVSDNLLRGIIPEEIGRLNNLEHFYLDSNAFKEQLPQFVFNLSSLKILYLSANRFFGTLPDNICRHLPNIEGFYLHENYLSGRIPSKLSDCKQLRFLSVEDNNLGGDIPKSISNLTSVKELYLGGNKLTGTIPENIGNLYSLEIIHLHENDIIGDIPPSLFNISTVKVISLLYNHLSGSLPPDFGLWVHSLEEIYLSTNNLSGPLPQSISNASQLSLLDISLNQFSGFIPDTLRALNKLEFLYLQSNSLTLTESTDNIFHAVAGLSQLKLLSLSLNPLSTRLPSSLGSNISNSLEKLYLSHCNLSGDIPATLANFSSLILLTLAGNQFSGSIPPSIGMLQKLQVLYLFTNLLDGTIPSELCQLEFLFDLELFSNMLSGSIPWCLGNRTSLRSLYLDSNKLSSAIPFTIWGITDIREVDLSSNSLTGSLSTEIGKLKALTYFSVSNNHLSGNISSSIGDLEALAYLNLSCNRFQGSIPDSMGKLFSLEYLDLSNNALFGVIPKTFEKLSYLSVLNLSCNKLYGEIPSGGHFWNFSAQSFIRNANLCGAPRLLVPLCKSGPRRGNRATVKFLAPAVIVVSILVMIALLIIAFRRKKSRKLDSEADLVTLRRVSPFELSAASNGFRDENLLGVGGFGSVYKGTLSDGLVVAIKVFNLQLEEALESFNSECQVLSGLRHRNLVKIVTCCSSPDFKALVLQYMPLGSLDKWLYSDDGSSLNLLQRLNIMVDVASALEYLHYGYSTPIVHCDLKPSNVLLDENMVAHVSDFGISKLLCGEDCMTQTMTLATIGYMAPEYGVGGVVSRRGDVYSFGIMLMEVFTKKKPTDDMFSGEMNLTQWVQNSIRNEVIDSDLLTPEDEECDKECIISVLELALACSASSPEERIDMKIAISELNKIKRKFIRNE